MAQPFYPMVINPLYAVIHFSVYLFARNRTYSTLEYGIRQQKRTDKALTVAHT